MKEPMYDMSDLINVVNLEPGEFIKCRVKALIPGSKPTSIKGVIVKVYKKYILINNGTFNYTIHKADILTGAVEIVVKIKKRSA